MTIPLDEFRRRADAPPTLHTYLAGLTQVREEMDTRALWQKRFSANPDAAVRMFDLELAFWRYAGGAAIPRGKKTSAPML